MKLSLTKRYTIFLVGVTITLLTISYFVTLSVMRDGLSDLFRRRLERSRTVIDQYARAEELVRRKEIETVVSSPRLVAAVATGDSATIALEAPAYQAVAAADLFVIGDASGNILFADLADRPEILPRVRARLLQADDRLEPTYVIAGDDLFQVTSAPIITADGFRMGLIAVGHRVRSYLPEDLRQLTGFDVVVSFENHIVGHTNSDLTKAIIEAEVAAVPSLPSRHHQIEDTSLNGERILSQTMPLHTAEVTLVASVDEHISPIMTEVSGLLISIAAIGGLLATTAIYVFTQRRIGRQVDLLVDAAKRMASDQFDFTITPASQDELGYLAGEFERTRARILENRRELDAAHEAQVNAERLAAIGRLTAGIVHDIKNPMAIIRSNAELIEHFAGTDNKLRSRSKQIQNQVDRMTDLTAELLEYSRGKTKLDLEAVPISEYLRSIVTSHHYPCQQVGVSIKARGDDECMVLIDAGRFRRVLDNLVNNAREVLRPGGVIAVSWCIRGQALEVSVSDTGPGIPEQIQETLFEPFVTMGKETGTGLGLAITRKIVEDHGGQISVHSKPELGATFRITLPTAATNDHVESVPHDTVGTGVVS